jgi:hypothetical protein
MIGSPALDHFCTWLQRTDASVAIQSHAWVIPTVQSVHILSIGAVAVSAIIIALRLFNAAWREQSTNDVSRTFLRVIWSALPVLLVSGVLMIVAEPVRSLENPVFVLKMALLLLAIASTLGFQLPLARDPQFWDAPGRRRVVSKLFSVTSLVLWAAVIFSGRWIAYIDTL